VAEFCSKDFRDVVIVERATEVDDTFGGYTVSWATQATIYCQIDTTGGGENIVGGRIEPTETLTLTCHYRTDFIESDRVNIGGKYYNIDRIENIDRRDRFLKIYIESGVRT
jgi:SPP1 family predicted phage head-tail adaptor